MGRLFQARNGMCSLWGRVHTRPAGCSPALSRGASCSIPPLPDPHLPGAESPRAPRSLGLCGEHSGLFTGQLMFLSLGARWLHVCVCLGGMWCLLEVSGL